MRKILAMGAFALTLTLAQTQEVSAWINHRFSIGLNWEWQSGNNNLLWGAFRNGNPGEPLPPGGFGHCFGHGCNTGFGFDNPFHYGASLEPPAYTPPPPSPTQAYYPPAYPYHNVGYGYYTMPVYYYPTGYFGR